MLQNQTTLLRTELTENIPRTTSGTSWASSSCMRKIWPLRLSEFPRENLLRAEHDAAAELGPLHWGLRESSWGTHWNSDPWFHIHNKSLVTCPLLQQAQHCFQSLGQCWCWWRHCCC